MSLVYPVRDIRNNRKCTSRVLFKRTGEINVVDLGNLIELTEPSDMGRVEHVTAAVGDAGGGYLRVNTREIGKIDWKYDITGDSFPLTNRRLLLLASAESTASQASAATHAVPAINVQPGESYYLGVYKLSGQALLFDGDPATEGTDFVLDYQSGILTILTGGAIAADTPLTGTVNVPAITMKKLTALTDMRVYGSAWIHHYDQFNANKLRERLYVANAQLYVTDRGTVKGDAWQQWKAELLCITDPESLERTDT